jgi:hypothetical protein
MRSKFWTLLLTGVAVTALAGFSPTTQDAEAGLFSRLRAHFHGNCGCSCSGEVVASCCPAPCAVPAPSCCPAPVATCCPAPCDACGHGGCGGGCDSDNDYDDDCDD